MDKFKLKNILGAKSMPEENKTKTAILFPGQGSQEKGMGRDIAEGRDQAMELWKMAEKVSNLSLREIYWEGDENAMAETRYLQPALTVVSLSLWDAVSSNFSPDYLAGHSVGEYVALAVAGVLDVQEVLELVSLRGRLMSEAGEEQHGMMAAVLKLNQDVVEDIVNRVKQETEEELCIANFNTPMQYVVSGTEKAVKIVVNYAKKSKGRAIPLSVSGAFHSNLMQEAAQELARYMDRFSWNNAQIPIHFNFTGKPEIRVDKIIENMKKQMISPVLWFQTILNQWDKGVRSWLEVGSKNVLAKMLPHILKDKDSNWQSDNIDSLEKIMKYEVG